MMSGVIDLVKTLSMESVIFGAGSIAQSMSGDSSFVSWCFLGAGIAVGLGLVSVEGKRVAGKEAVK